MGRNRIRDRHLPRRMYLVHGAYYFHPKGGKPVHLGRDLSGALQKYGTLIGEAWTGRTIGDAIDRYRIEVLPLKRSAATRDKEGHGLDRLKAVFGHILPDNLTAQHCYRYADERRGPKGTRVPTVARHEVGLLRHVYGKMIRWGLATKNPARGLQWDSRTPRDRYVTDDEFAAVLKLATPRMRLAMELARLTGQRRGDLLALRRDQVTEQGLEFHQGKTGARVTVEWSPALRDVVARCKAMRPQLPGIYLLRPRGGGHYSPTGFAANWQRTMRAFVKAGGRRFTFHDLRAKAASDMPTIEAAAALLGHASSETTKRVYKRTPTLAKPSA